MAYRAGCRFASRFRDNGDGKVTDSVTGLMREKASSPDGVTWPEDQAQIEAMTLGGHEDRRMPTVDELLTLVDFGWADSATDPVFVGIKDPYFWHGSNLPL